MGSRQPGWLSFQDWIAQQQSEEQIDDIGVPTSPDSSMGANASASPINEATSNPPSTSGNSPLPRPTPTPALARDCRTETRLVDGSARARQEMTIMLSAPGVPLHKAPLVTAKQAAALMSALCEPLVQVRVGRLTRRMEAPTKLSPTSEVGFLSLWLLPNDDLSLVWQAREQQSAADDVIEDEEELNESAAVGSADSDVTLWEELVRFPAGALPTVDEPLVIIHMLRGDSTGRSFYIRPREDIMAEHIAANMPANAPIETAKIIVDDVGGPSSPGLLGSQQQQQAASRLYFWVAEENVAAGIHNLGRLKSLLKRPPSLARRSGISESQLAQISSWLQALEMGPAAQRSNSLLRGALSPGGSTSTTTEEQSQAEVPPAVRNADGVTVPSQTALQSAFRDFQMEPASSRLARISQPTVVRSNRGAATSTVCATAAALYQDRRFNVAYPCVISVAVSVSLTARPGELRTALTEEACTRAKALAESTARSAVDRAGRQRIEERVCESFICTMKAQRARAKAEKQQRRDLAARAQQVAKSKPLIEKAVQHLKQQSVVNNNDNNASATVAAAVLTAEDSQESLMTPPPSQRQVASPLTVAATTSNTVNNGVSRSISEEPDDASSLAQVGDVRKRLADDLQRNQRVDINDLQSLLNTAATSAGAAATNVEPAQDGNEKRKVQVNDED